MVGACKGFITLCLDRRIMSFLSFFRTKEECRERDWQRYFTCSDEKLRRIYEIIER